MTLTTRVLVVEPTPARALFEECRRLLGCTPAHQFAHDQPANFSPLGVNEYRNLAWQNLDALLSVTYGVEAPFRYDSDEEGEDNQWPVREWTVTVYFDTAYGGLSDRGESCSQLHSRLVAELGQYLSDLGLTWYWNNEFTGEWHLGSRSAPVLISA